MLCPNEQQLSNVQVELQLDNNQDVTNQYTTSLKTLWGGCPPLVIITLIKPVIAFFVTLKSALWISNDHPV